jgi:hypothetical protein
MIDDHHVIEDSYTGEQWTEFERAVGLLEPDELAAIADRLGLSIDAEAHWRDFLAAFGRESWRDFTEAYSYVMRTDYIRTEEEPEETEADDETDTDKA